MTQSSSAALVKLKWRAAASKDFSEFNGGKRLYISISIHKIFVYNRQDLIRISFSNTSNKKTSFVLSYPFSYNTTILNDW